MIYTIAISEEERSRIIKNLSDEAKDGDSLDRQVLEAFVRGSQDNTQSPNTLWADAVIDTRYSYYKED